MFTGIIETTALVQDIIINGTNKTFWLQSNLSGEFKTDQSVAHSGVCLTVEETRDGMHRVTAIDETLSKTTLGSWQPGDLVNIERCMQMNGRLDGHIVQGHVDATGICDNAVTKEGSWEFRITIPSRFAPLIIEKGSISLNGISLTIFDVDLTGFTIAIIPYTFEHTNLNQLKKGDAVNIEFDMIGKYVNRLHQIAG